MTTTLTVSLAQLLFNADKNTQTNLTASLASWILHYYSDIDQWDSVDELNILKSSVESLLASYSEENSLLLTKAIEDPRIQLNDNYDDHQKDCIFKIYTDYELAKLIIHLPKKIVFVDNISEADFLFVTAHISDFLSLPLSQRVCQFPYEGGFVRKDLLPVTVRKHCKIGLERSSYPFWWLPCFDLSTEFHLFSHYYNNNINDQRSSWIIKPAQGTRGVGHKVVSNNITNESDKQSQLQLISHYSNPFSYNTPIATNLAIDVDKGIKHNNNQFNCDKYDKVIQLLVDKPLLVRGYKFDIRAFVFVRSFVPFDAYWHQLYYARVANKEYNINDLSDREVCITGFIYNNMYNNNLIITTVSAYDEDDSISKKQIRLLYDDLKEELEAENHDLNFDKMMEKVFLLLSELFSGIARSVGKWPQSSAYYAVDVIFDNNDCIDGIPTAKLIEVNFMGDWTGVEYAVKEKVHLYTEWANDLITVLATKDDLSNNSRLRKLNDQLL